MIRKSPIEQTSMNRRDSNVYDTYVRYHVDFS